jgi:hypothetical protein
MVAGIALSGCATSTQMRGPDGQVGYLIECPGAALSMGACFEKANSLCPAGYTVLDTRQQVGATSFTQYGMMQNVERQLMVQCAS